MNDHKIDPKKPHLPHQKKFQIFFKGQAEPFYKFKNKKKLSLSGDHP
jgi:hypothetical protein